MKKVNYFLCFTLLITISVFAQEKQQHKIGIVTDNDLYVSIYLDQYYTNGAQLFYQWVADSKLADKKIHEIKLTQEMYNPFQVNVPYVKYIDRPYAGYLCANYNEKYTQPTYNITLGIEGGISGEASKAEESQNFIHQFYGISPSTGWRYQIAKKWLYKVKTQYQQQLLRSKNNHHELSGEISTNLGNVQTNLNAELNYRMSLKDFTLGNFNNTTFNKTNLQLEDKPVPEFFIGFTSKATRQLYDYTVTGTTYNNSSNKMYALVPWVVTHDIGIFSASKHWDFSYHQYFYTKNVESISKHWIRYGSLQFAYKF